MISRELRWFGADAASGERLQTLLKTKMRPEERTDVYYRAAPKVGVKLRERPDGTTNFEVKVLLADHGSQEFPSCTGRVESWAKFSIAKATLTNLHEPITSRLRVVVGKARLLRKFEFNTDDGALREVSPDAIVRAGCGAEFTWITVEGVRYWTFGFEAFWEGATELQVLQPVIAKTISRILDTADSALTLACSSSYPVWLERFGSGARHL